MKNIAIVFLFLMLFAFVSYSQDKVFSETDTEISVSKEELFDIKLSSNKSTGYSWSVTVEESNPQGVVSELGSDYEAVQPGRIGGGGNEIWHFKAVESGSVKLVFKYARSWEDKEPAKTIIYNVSVQ